MKLKKMEEQKTQSNKVRCLAAGQELQERAAFVSALPAGAQLTAACPSQVPALGLLWPSCSCSSPWVLSPC